MPLAQTIHALGPLVLFAAAAGAGESYETAPVRPEGSSYVPPPFAALATEPAAVGCEGRRYDLRGAVPMPTVAGQPVLERGEFVLDGKPLADVPPRWTLVTPAVAIATRTWNQGDVAVTLKQTVEYDGFITSDLVLAPTAGSATIRELALRLVFRPETSTLYHIPSASTTPAGLWPKKLAIETPIPGLWGGNDRMGLACYVATFRDWRGSGPWIVLEREEDGPGSVLGRIISEPTELKAPLNYRLGFIATPVRAPEKRHWQIFSLPTSPDDLQAAVRRNLFWGNLSDRYATFSTNAREGDAAKAALVREVQGRGKAALAYTTYAHVEEGAVEVPHAWRLVTSKGKTVASSIGGSMADRNRVFCCPGSREWVDWKLADLKEAVARYGVDGFYVDTSYVIQACANEEHGHGWVDRTGQLQADFPTWSMREIWRHAYEMLCQTRGKADIYAHHKGGCPAALAAFTSAFCDGEQYTSQSLRNLTLDAFRAQISGRNMGPLAMYLEEYYRSLHLGRLRSSGHDNPVESIMLALVHDVLPTGYPGNHPVRELVMLRDDLGIAEATWIPYYAPDSPWKAQGAEGVVVSAYRTSRGDSLLVAANPNYADAQIAQLSGPTEATEGRTFVAIDVLSRVGRQSTSTAGYRWEKASPSGLAIPARSLRLFAWIRQPESLAAFARQQGFTSSNASHERRVPIPAGATLLDDFEDPDWTLASDEGGVTTTDREPVDTRRALRVLPAPKHDAAALLRRFEELQDWSSCQALSFWIRPDRGLPVRALDLRLRDGRRYGPPLALVSHGVKDRLPAGQWTQLRYEFRKAPRETVEILRIYFDRGDLSSGPFDLDEMLLLGGPPRKTAAQPAKSDGKKAVTPIDRPGGTPQ